jgi:hypothetical protein
MRSAVVIAALRGIGPCVPIRIGAVPAGSRIDGDGQERLVFELGRASRNATLNIAARRSE